MARGAILLWNKIPPAPFSKGGETPASSYSPFSNGGETPGSSYSPLNKADNYPHMTPRLWAKCVLGEQEATNSGSGLYALQASP
jgi:hypothetical protein